MEVNFRMSNNKIPFGLRDGVLVEVSEVKSGLACGCICPSCHGKLQANKGQKVSHYFSHDPSNATKTTKACESAFETSIHLMAKQILSEEGVSKFPKLSVTLTQKDKLGNSHEETCMVTEESLMKFSHVKLEQQLSVIRPDIIAYNSSTPYLIEIAVTHFVDTEKLKWIRANEMYAIEIDLSKVTYTTTKEALKQLIIESVANKKWLSNPEAHAKKSELKMKLDERVRVVNENIDKAKLKNKVASHIDVVVPQKKNVTSGYDSKTKNIKESDPRWFLCEACRHVFKVALKDAPYTIKSIPCPECEHAISAR